MLQSQSSAEQAYPKIRRIVNSLRLTIVIALMLYLTPGQLDSKVMWCIFLHKTYRAYTNVTTCIVIVRWVIWWYDGIVLLRLASISGVCAKIQTCWHESFWLGETLGKINWFSPRYKLQTDTKPRMWYSLQTVVSLYCAFSYLLVHVHTLYHVGFAPCNPCIPVGIK